MKSSKIIQYLRTLDKEEWQRFNRFVHSPYFHSHEETTRLWETLYSIYPDLSDELVSKEQVFARTFPQTPFNERKLYNLSKYLLRLLTEFLIVERRKNDHFEREYMTQFYLLAERHLDQYIPRLIRQGEQVLDKLKGEDSEAALLEYQFAFLQMNYALSRNNRSIESGINEVSERLDRFYVLEKLRLAVPIANRNFILAQQTELDFVDEVLQMYQHYQWEDYPLLRAHYLALQMFQQAEEEAHFRHFAHYLGENASRIPLAESRTLYNLALNFCSIQSKRGKSEYLEKMFGLFEDMLQQELLLSDSSTAGPNFKNAVTLAIKLKKFAWTENFIRLYGSRLPESHRDIIIHYSLANLNFVQKKFSAAQKHLLEVEFLDPFYRLVSDILLLKIYYELGEAEALYFRYQAFRKYIQRDKTLSEANRKAYANFARLLFKMTRLRFDHSGGVTSLLNLWKSLSPLVERQWLEEKLNVFTSDISPE